MPVRALAGLCMGAATPQTRIRGGFPGYLARERHAAAGPQALPISPAVGELGEAE